MDPEIKDPEISQNPFPGAEVSPGLAQQTPEALRHLKKQVLAGTPWHRALLEAIGLWTQAEEEYQVSRACASPLNTIKHVLRNTLRAVSTLSVRSD